MVTGYDHYVNIPMSTAPEDVPEIMPGMLQGYLTKEEQ